MRSSGGAAFRRIAPVWAGIFLALLLAGCSGFGGIGNRWGVPASRRVIGFGQPVPKGGGSYMVGAPYVVGGRRYVPRVNRHYDKVGLASWYGADFRGRYTANGEIYDSGSISAANPTLPLPSYVRVTNLHNGRSLVVRVNDRGPFVGNRIIDVSARAARLLGFYRRGTTRVRVQYVGRAPLRGSNDDVLAATLRQERPAPSPRTLRLAERSIFPPAPRPPSTHEMLASAAFADPSPALDPADPPDRRALQRRAGRGSTATTGTTGTAQLLNGRGLY